MEKKGTYMKKVLRIISINLMALLIAVSVPHNAFAAQVILGLSKTDISVGDTFTVSIAGSSTSRLSLHYDGTMVSLTDQNNARLDGNTLTVTARSVSFTFKAKKQGQAGFVASSDVDSRSSVMVNIESSETADPEDASSEKDNSEEKTTDDASTDTDATVSDSSDADTAKQTVTEDTSASSETDNDTDDAAKYAITSSDLSFAALITDRRMILVIGILSAIIIALIIRLVVLHYSISDSDYEGDDIDFDENEKQIREQEKVSDDKAAEPDEKAIIADELGIDEEKLTMPKAPKTPNQKLKLEDLNDL